MPNQPTPADRIRAALDGKPRVHRDPKLRPFDGSLGCLAEVSPLDVIAVAEPLAADPVAAALLAGARGAAADVRHPAAVKVHQLADDLYYLLELAGDE